MPLAIAGVLAVAVGGVVGMGEVAQSQSQNQRQLSLEPNRVNIRLVEEGDRRVTAFVLRQGLRYRFEVSYDVAGAPQIRTGHTFVFTNLTTGQQIDVDSRSFDPEGPGAYTESSNSTLNARWTPGVYRMEWTLRASAPEARSAQSEGAVTFVVAGPAGPAGAAG